MKSQMKKGFNALRIHQSKRVWIIRQMLNGFYGHYLCWWWMKIVAKTREVT